MKSQQPTQESRTSFSSTPAMTRKSRLCRLLRLSHILKTGGTRARLDRLRADYGTSRRTLFRDLQLLRSTGLKVEFIKASNIYTISDFVEFPFESMKIVDLGTLLAVLSYDSDSSSPVAPYARVALDELNAFVSLLDEGVQTAIEEATISAMIPIRSRFRYPAAESATG